MEPLGIPSVGLRHASLWPRSFPAARKPMSIPGPSPSIRPLTNMMKWLLYAASVLVFLAGFQLTVFSEQTATYFAWTISPPITAAFLGAAYWAAVPVEVIAARQSSWAEARVAIPAIWLFTTLTLIITLVHVDKFHFSSPVLSAQAAAWFWLAIYAGVPVAMLVIGWLQVRVPGGDPPHGPAPPTWMRIVVLGQGGGRFVFGVGLLLLPTVVGAVWPWTLTALTGRAIGAWFVGVGFAALHATRENDLSRIRPLEGGYAVFAALQLVALARYSGSSYLDWGAPAMWVYVGFLLSILFVGIYRWTVLRLRKPR